MTKTVSIPQENGKNQVTVSAEFLQERITKRTVRFYEVDDGSGEKITGILYIQQSALKKLGYKEGDTLVVTLSIKEDK